MLPSALLQESGGKRTARDWLVDVLMTLIAVGIGVLVYAESEQSHSDLEDLLDVTLGVISVIALWWRRRWPAGVGLLITVASAFSAFSAGAALIALFNIALRGTRRQIIAVTAVGIAGGGSVYINRSNADVRSSTKQVAEWVAQGLGTARGPQGQYLRITF